MAASSSVPTQPIPMKHQPIPMKQTNFKLWLTACVVSCLACGPVGATAILTEAFSGYADGLLGNTGTGGGGAIPGWNTPQNQITVTNSLGSLDGASLGLSASSGAMVSIT